MVTAARTRSTQYTLLKVLGTIAIIGAINWGLIGLFNWNLVDAIFGGGVQEETSPISRIVYTLVGLCGLTALPMLLSRHADEMPTSRGV
jgi:uncharacterized protein